MRKHRIDLLNCALLLALNVFLTRELFSINYLNHFSSIEGAFISMARYMKDHWGNFAWWHLWNSGIPFEYVYVPLLHTAVAGLASVTNWPTARAYHFLVATAYCFGPVMLYILARSLSANAPTALASGLLYTLFSPSLLFLADIRADSGGIFSARRLRVLTVYGEGPHITALTLIPLALAALYRCFQRYSLRRSALAALALAAIIMTNTPATMAMATAVACLLFAMPTPPIMLTAFVAAWAYTLSMYAVPPSYIKLILRNLSTTHAGFSSGWEKLILLAAVLLFIYGLGRLLGPLPLYLRFGILYSAFLLAVVPGANSSNFELLPEAGRLHLELELALSLSIAGVMSLLYQSSPRVGKFLLLLAAGGAAATLSQHFRTRAAFDLTAANVESRSEYQSARWLADHPDSWHGRVYAPGSNAFWLNTFTDIPQVTGCCNQGRSSTMPDKLSFVVNLAETEEQRQRAVLWLQAFGVGAVIASGPQSTEEYKDFRNAQKFRDQLQVLHEGFGDVLYAVPNPAPELVQILEGNQVLTVGPESADFYGKLEEYVEGASFSTPPTVHWNNSHSATISATMDPTQVLSVKISSVPGWRATVAGKRVPIERDPLDFMLLKPSCNGACEINLQWSSPFPVWITALGSLSALLFCLISLATFRRAP